MALESARKVLGARLVWIDQEYFAKLCPVRSRQAFNKVILDRFSLLSDAQFRGKGVNTPVRVGHANVKVDRPVGYGRAFIVETEWGTYDVKGTGVAPGSVPRLEQHSTGLLTLPAAVTEICAERMARQCLSSAGIETAKCVALILLPTYLLDPMLPGGKVPCALLVRESFPRVKVDPERFETCFQLLEFALNCEKTLRKAGLTTTDNTTNVFISNNNGAAFSSVNGVIAPHAVAQAIQATQTELPQGLTEFDTLNVQLCIDVNRKKLRMVDFGSVQYQQSFQNTMLVGALSRTNFDLPSKAEMFTTGQCFVRSNGFAFAMTSEQAFNPKGKVSDSSPLLEMIPYSTDQNRNYKTKRAAAGVFDLLKANSDVERLCSEICKIILMVNNDYDSSSKNTTRG